MKIVSKVILAVIMALAGNSALAWTLEGYVFCASNGQPVSGAIVNVSNANGFTNYSMTDSWGKYTVTLDGNGDYLASLDLSPVDPAGYVVSPSNPTAFTYSGNTVLIDWAVVVAGCEKKGCWLTGGGAKFDPLMGLNAAQKGPKVSFGGNVNPSCSPEPGDGGQWSHVDHDVKLFFQGTAIVVDDCGNVDGIPPGSDSPATPFNFIEYHGTGTLKGIAGNKFSKTDVCFVARAEDRNEPGSNGQNDGALKDRYFLRVFDCADNTELLVLEKTPGAGDPITITDGNLQIHISSCVQ